MALHQTSGRWQLGVALMLLTVLMFGILPLGLKGALNDIPPATISWFRFLVASILMAPFFAPRLGRMKTALKKPRYSLLFATATGCLLINFLCFMFGLGYITASAAQVVGQLATPLTILGGLWIFKERYSLKQGVGLVVMLVGMGLFFNLRLDEFTSLSSDQMTSDYLFGLLLIVAAATLWAGYGLAQKQLLVELRAQEIMWLIYIAGAVLFLPLAEPEALLQLSLNGWLLLSGCMLLSVLAFAAFAEALVHLEASRVSPFLSSAPVITLLAAQLLADWNPNLITTEPANSLTWLGALTVVLGSILAVSGPATAKPKES